MHLLQCCRFFFIPVLMMSRLSLPWSNYKDLYSYKRETVDKASAEVEVKTVASGSTHAYLPTSLKYFDFENQGETTTLSAVHQANNNGMVVADADAATGTPAQWKWSTSNSPILFPIPYDQIQLTDWAQNDGY